MEAKPLIVERTFDTPLRTVWAAITEKEQMKEWYFQLDEFNAEKGFRFRFTGGDEHVQYVHECEVLECEPPHKLSYSWTYPEYEGYSVLTWQLFDEGGNRTRLWLSHDGLESFPQDNSNFGVESFSGGWNYIINESLTAFLERNHNE